MKNRSTLTVGCLACLAVLAGCATAQQETPEPWPLAVRIHSYGAYQDEAWTHLPSIGVHHIFLATPAEDEVEATMAKLAEHGLTAVVLRGSADLAGETFAGDLAPQLAICERMGVRYMFLSAKRGELPPETVFARLRAAGDIARRHGVVITLETHPDLGTNGEVQAETMRGVNHPNVRVNFDTANITYYNTGADAAAELEKSVEYVRTVEFKDHAGGYETWDFPVLGRGVVDIPAIVALLREHGYAGPVTLEFEGTKGVELTKEQTLEAIAGCVAYARTTADFQ